MMYAYDEMYLNDATRNLGEAFDYAANACGITLPDFMDMFVVGGIAEQFGAGSPKYLCGMSGMELVYEVVRKAGRDCLWEEALIEYNPTPEFWGGYILAYYQWYTGRSFKNIHNSLSVDYIVSLYPALHEAPEAKSVDTLNLLIEKSDTEASRLQQLRRLAGYSQKLLSKQSGVSLRMIQQYEQGVKDINKASVTNLLALSRQLGCRIEDLIEY